MNKLRVIALLTTLSIPFLSFADMVNINTNAGNSFIKDGRTFTDLQTGYEFLSTGVIDGISSAQFTVVDERTIESNGFVYSLASSSIIVDLVNTFFGLNVDHDNLPITYNRPISNSGQPEVELLTFIDMLGKRYNTGYVAGGGRAPDLDGYVPTQFALSLILNDRTATPDDYTQSIAFSYQYQTSSGDFSHYYSGFHISFTEGHTQTLDSSAINGTNPFLFYRDINNPIMASSTDVNGPVLLSFLAFFGLLLSRRKTIYPNN